MYPPSLSLRPEIQGASLNPDAKGIFNQCIAAPVDDHNLGLHICCCCCCCSTPGYTAGAHQHLILADIIHLWCYIMLQNVLLVQARVLHGLVMLLAAACAGAAGAAAAY
jgi:hypothetical protein